MEPMNDLDRELARSVRIEPSPDFAARVRSRIALEPAPSRWNVPALALATAGAVVIGVLVANVMTQSTQRQVSPVSGVLEHQDLTVMAPLRAPVPAIQHHGSESRMPHVIISKSEMLALQQLFSGAVVAPPATPVADELVIGELVIESIAMPSIPEGERQ
jgi:hypothetical protein